jgi:hypothetical protein
VDASTVALNLAYISYVAVSFVPGGLRLRIALVLQSLTFIGWGVVSDTPSVIFWNVAFAAVNVWQEVRVARRDHVDLGVAEEEARSAMFDSLSRRDFLVLCSAGQSGEAGVGEQLCAVGERRDEPLLLLNGNVEVRTSTGFDVVGRRHMFVGEMSFLSGRPTSADVWAAEPVTFRRWKFDDVRRLEQLNLDVARSVEKAMGRDVAAKLRA